MASNGLDDYSEREFLMHWVMQVILTFFVVVYNSYLGFPKRAVFLTFFLV